VSSVLVPLCLKYLHNEKYDMVLGSEKYFLVPINYLLYKLLILRSFILENISRYICLTE